MNALGCEIAKTLRVLREGGVILYPTDTIWGLGCAAFNPGGIKRIAELKGRCERQTMILLVSSMDMLQEYVPNLPEPLREELLSSSRPLTVIYPKPEGVPSYLLASDGSVAIRVVHHPFCQMLIENLHEPLTSTSANLTNQPPPTAYEGIAPEILHGVDYAVSSEYDSAPPSSASRIVRLVGMGGEYEVVRR